MSQTLVGPASTVPRVPAPPPRFECTLRDGGLGAAWVRVAGELDIATAPQLEQVLRQAEARARRVVLDLRGLAFMDCSGVQVILDAGTSATAARRRLVLVRGPSQVDRVLTLTGASDVLEIVDLEPLQPSVQALVGLVRNEHAA